MIRTSTFVATFMGDANRARSVLSNRSGVVGEVTIGAQRLVLAHRGLADGDVEIAIRPEAIRLCPPGYAALAASVRKAPTSEA